MGLRRGFKTEADRYAREFRDELSLKPHSPLCPRKLSDWLGVNIIPLSHFKDNLPEAVKQLGHKDPNSFSAATVFFGLKRMIVFNDYHSFGRQAANIAHELSHAILGHPPTVPFNEHGCRNFSRDIEDEANWLGPTLLISKEAAWHIAKQKMNYEDAAQLYGCTSDVVRFRVNVTGAGKKFR